MDLEMNAWEALLELRDQRRNQVRVDGRQDSHGHLADQICMATGGPCKYSGRDMKTTHAGMKISNADFGALVEDLVKALDTFKVPAQEKSELLGLLGPMKKDIVETP
jgi:hemoglobin